MLKVYTCITTQHDLRLVTLAAFICALASFTAVNLLHHAWRSQREMRRIWLTVAAIATGFGIWATHFIAMLAFQPGLPSGYNVALTIASLVAAIGLTGAGLTIAWKVLGAVILTIAICSHHFTAMAAAAIIPDPRIIVPPLALPVAWMAIGVAMISAVIILLVFVGLAADLRDRRRAVREAVRMRNLADAAVEGLVVCDGTDIVAANHSFTALTCADDRTELIGLSLLSFFPEIGLDELKDQGHRPIEAVLRATNGSAIPIELVQRDIDYAGRPHQVFAVRDLRERKQAREDIYFLAHHDPLTKLPNRTSFNKKLEAEFAAHRGTDRGFGVIFLDLDRFKEINDLFGHPIGDAVLQLVADKIQSVLKPGAMVARLGGDEFAVIVPGLPGPAYATRTAEAILEVLRKEDENLPAGVTLNTSIGIATFPKDADDRASLLSNADAALYEAKAEGRGIYRVFEPSMGQRLRNRRQLEHDIRHALSRNELSLVYQPQADLHSNQVFGFEALLRWKHATRGAISPAVFVPIAEDCGAIVHIGEWVLRTACTEAARWKRPLETAADNRRKRFGGPAPRQQSAGAGEKRIERDRT